MRVRDGVLTFDLDWNRGEPLSVHVIQTPGGSVLFGAGDESTADAVVRIATDHGIAGVVVEHGDVDHYGGVPALRSALDVEVAVPAGDAGFLLEEGIEPDRRLTDGERFMGVLAIELPGHTPGNMAFLYDGVLVAGDTVAGVDSRYAAEGDWSGPLTVMDRDHNAMNRRAREVVKRLADYDIETVLVTHGDHVLEGGNAAIATLIEDLAAE